MYRTALALESGARAVAQGTLSWSEEVAGHVRQSVDDLLTLVQRTVQEPDLDSVATGSVQRWGSAGVDLPAGGVPLVRSSGSGRYR